MSDRAAHDPETLEFYAEEAPVYVASGPGGASRHLHGFLGRLKPGATILELGCGGGRDSEAMLARGFEIDPTDGVREIARQAEARIGRQVRVMRFDELDAVERYDAVWAHASLLHVPRAALPDVLARIFAALRPGGWHFANYKSGGTEGRDGFGRYFNYLSIEQAVDAYRSSGDWEIVATDEYLDRGYYNRPGPWIAITARKPKR
jgi:SAM-dependent methyltransferase